MIVKPGVPKVAKKVQMAAVRFITLIYSYDLFQNVACLWEFCLANLGDEPGRVCMHPPPPTTPPNDIFLNLFDALNTNLHVNIENVGILTM